MGRVDHQSVRLATLARQRGENLVEDPEPAPAHETVVDRLVRAVAGWHITPAQTLRITKTIPLITRRSSTLGMPCDCGKYGSIRRICASDSKIKSPMAAPPRAAVNQTFASWTRKLMGPEPNCFIS